MEAIVKSTIHAFSDRLPELDWLDKVTRKAAGEKASSIGIVIGYATSPNVTDPESLQRYYTHNRPVEGHYFESVLKTRYREERRKWATVGQQRDPGVWDMIPPEVST